MADQLRDAIAAIKAGDKGKGKRLLSIVIQAEPQNAEAWSLLAEVLDDPQQIVFCRQRAQSIATTKLSPPIREGWTSQDSPRLHRGLEGKKAGSVN